MPEWSTHLAASGWLWLHFESGTQQNQLLGPDLFHSPARNQADPSDSASAWPKAATRHAVRSGPAVRAAIFSPSRTAI